MSLENSFTFYVPNLFCGGCSKRLKQGLMSQLNEHEVEENNIICDTLKQQLTIKLNKTSKLSSEKIKRSLDAIGFPAHQLSIDKTLQSQQQRSFLKRIFTAGIGTMQVMMFSVTIYMQKDMSLDWMLTFHWFSLWVTTGVLLYAGKPYFLSALNALSNKQVNMDVPVVIALVLAYLYSFGSILNEQTDVYFDSINMFLFFITLGRFLEWRARHHAQQASDALQEMVPNHAQKVMASGETTWVEVKELQKNDHILVAHGETIPADLSLISGETTVDESLLTGESKPIFREPGQTLFAGTLNLGNTIEGKVEHTSEQTRLGQIQRLLIQAQATRPRLAQWADQVAGYFVLALLIFSALIACCWYWIDPTQIIPVTISVLIVTCPCALSLATPAALASALGQLAKHGIVLSRSNALEKLLKVNHFVFDKTGTLTKGKFGIAHTVSFTEHPIEEVLSIAAAMEKGETHPISRAFTNWHDTTVIALNKSLIPGLGITAWIEDTQYWLGGANRIQSACPKLPPPPPTTMPEATNIYLATQDAWLAVFSLKDSLKPDAKSLIDTLTPKHTLTLLSGDQQPTVKAVAQSLQIDDFQAQCLPEDKQKIISQAQKRGDCIAMVGDGANDSPVLAQADVGIAMGSGTALAHASADIIVLNPSLMSIHTLGTIALQTKHLISQNMLWALGYNTIALPFAAMGWVPAWLAAIGMSLSSLVVVTNSLRIRSPIDKNFSIESSAQLKTQ